MLTLGTYPEVSLAEAREKRNDARKILRAGRDPRHSMKRSLAARFLALTVQRPGMVRNIEWDDVQGVDWGKSNSDIDEATWVVPAAKIKQERHLRSDEAFEHPVPLAGSAVDIYRLGIKVYGDFAGVDDRLGVSIGAADHGVDARDQLIAMKRFGHVIVGAEAEAADLGIHLCVARQDQHWRFYFGHAHFLEHVMTMHVGQVEIEENDVVIIQFNQIEALLAQVGRINDKTLALEH